MTYDEFIAKFNIELSEQQAKAVQSIDGAVLLLAVPGSGKTTTLVTRLGYMLYCGGVAPENILTMTYTVPASRDMRGRFAAIFGDEYAGRLEFRTINSVCLSIINSYARQSGSTMPELMDNNAKLLTDVYRKVQNEYPAESDIRDLQMLISYIKNMRLTKDEIAELELGDIPAAPIYEAYLAEMKAQGRMDYDDQLVYARTVLLKCPDILERLRRRYRHICVDEAQDTSKIQHEIIRILAGEDGNIFMVGDEDQSIYGFRAAFPDALMSFEGDYRNSSVLLLEQNYRSTPEIVSAADHFIAFNQTRHEKHMSATRPSGSPVRKVALKDRSAQYAYIAKIAENEPSRETAILYRNNDSAVPLIDYLDRSGIPFRCRQAESTFFSNRTVSSAVDILTLALEPLNRDAFMNVYYKFALPINRAMADKAVALCNSGKAVSLMAALLKTATLKGRSADKLQALIPHFVALRSDSGRDALNRIRYEMGYGAYVLKNSGDTERLFLLSVLAAREPDIKSLLSRLKVLKRITDSGGDAGSKLILSTIHSSKGLEYDRVIVIDAIDGILPSVTVSPGTVLDDDDRKTLEEERRLFYVAATRAKNELLLLTYTRQGEASFIDPFFQVLPSSPAATSPTAKSKVPIKSLSRSLSQEEKWAMKDLIPGTWVRHNSFGRGRIFSVDPDGDIISINFTDKGFKRLSLSGCVSKHLLTREL